MSYTADRVCEIAEMQVGYLEKRSNKDLDSKTANAGGGNYTKYGRDMHNLDPSVMDFPAKWCDAFVDWCHYQAADRDAAKARYGLCGGFNDYTVESAKLYKDAGRWGYKPHKGDQVFFKNSNGICHTGIVVRATDTRIYTVEGNKGNAVDSCSYPLGDSRIAGYGYPRYGGGSDVKPTPSQYLSVDGYFGTKTAKAWQKAMGTTQDGVISHQTTGTKKYHQAMERGVVQYDSTRKGSNLVRAVQRKFGLGSDGLLGPNTVKAVQRHLGVKADGYFGSNTTKALQRRLNQNKF